MASVTRCASALHLEIVECSNDRIGVIEQILRGWTESWILVEFYWPNSSP